MGPQPHLNLRTNVLLPCEASHVLHSGFGEDEYQRLEGDWVSTSGFGVVNVVQLRQAIMERLAVKGAASDEKAHGLAICLERPSVFFMYSL